MKSKFHTMKYISRIDSHNTHCYTVRVGYDVQVATHKTFSDGVYGGRAKALKAAQIYRDKEYKRLKPILDKLYSYDINKQRHWGQDCHEAWETKNGYEYLHIRTQYWDGKRKKQLTKQFSVNKYGYDKAVLLATQWRKLKLTGEL